MNSDAIVCLQVFIQEHKACEVSLTTHMVTCVLAGLPYLLLLPCLVAIVVIPLCNLNALGELSPLSSHLCLDPLPFPAFTLGATSAEVIHP